jgi:hypothetical protein
MFIKELPFRGTPIKMVKTNDNGFLLITQIANPYDAVVVKYDSNGNLMKVTRMVNIDSVGAGGFPSLMKMNDSTYLLRISRADIGQYFYKLNIDGEKIDSFSMPNPSLTLPPCIFSSNKIYGEAGKLYKINLNFQVDTSIVIPNVFWELSSNSLNDILLSGPEDNPFFPTEIFYRVYDSDLNLKVQKKYFDKDHKSFAINNGWVFYFKGLFKLNSSLDSVWYHPYSEFMFSGSESQEATDIKQTSDGGYILTGEVWNPFYHIPFLIKTDSMGNLVWKKGYNSVADRSVSVEQVADGGYVMFQGGEVDSLQTRRMFLVKTNADGALGVNNYNSNSLIVSVYPNPVTELIYISFKSDFTGNINLVDMIGRSLFVEVINEKKQIKIPIEYLNKGMYLLNIQEENSIRNIVVKILKN